MQRNCDSCDRPYEAKTARSRFCDTTCRMRWHRVNGPKSAHVARKDEPGLVAATRKALEAAGRVDTVAGQQALCIAVQMCSFGTGGAIASLSKELRTTMIDALGHSAAPSPTSGADEDELEKVRAKRDAKRRRAG